jgi:1-acyl-sn-glycerol-3-phosphate acyltransferase
VGAYYSAARFFANAFLGFISGREVRGAESIPRSGGLIVASNHISFWDPPLVGAALPREAYFLAKEELFSNPVLGPVIRSVNAIPIRRGAADLSGLTRAMETLKGGGALLMFPEGSRMRDGELHPARPGVGLIAVQADVPIVPCYISGSNRPRRWLYRGTRVRIWFGVPRHWRELVGGDSDATGGRLLYQRVGDALMREIAALKSNQEASASRGAA